MRAIVTGMVATYPLGGVAWDYGQYALGLERLGFQIYYLEDVGLPAYSINDKTGEYREDCTQGVQFLQESLSALSPSLGRRWHYRGFDNSSHGIPAAEMEEIVAGADILVNISGATLLREPYRRCRRKVLIDTDPGWNHFVIWPRWDAKTSLEQEMGFRAHDQFFTYALRMGQPDCPLDTFGVRWHPTRPPVVLDCWRPQPPAKRWTTVMMWKNYERPVIHNGMEYGAKEKEFWRIQSVPRDCSAAFEVAVSGPAPREQLQSLGWSVVGAHGKSDTPDAYRNYIQSSRGEFSVAKNIYVATHSGWFSCRTVCYLAAGRPAVVQDTGFSQLIPTGDGLFAFTGSGDAVRAVEAVEADYNAHSRAARALAEAEFDARKVLNDLLEQVGREQPW